jgi:3-deoxy-D-manno-octulosonic-acid transferase
MLFIYNLGIRIYVILIYIAQLFNKKAKKWLLGRKNNNLMQCNKSILFHFASLGEFEQGRPVLEKLRQQTNQKIVVTFFSPSGYEVRKNTPLADYVYYLPIDTAANARQFIDTINPTMAVFTKYEYWYHYFNEFNKRQIPLYIISGIFRPEQVFFKWYGGLHRKMLGFVTRFFVQDENSKNLLHSIGVDNADVSGDTRFDRVWETCQAPQANAIARKFKDEQPLFIAGSTWPDDEKLVAQLVDLYPDWKFIIAPHEVGEQKINGLINLLSGKKTIKYSEVNNDTNIADYQILVIDNIGILSSLYQYGNVAYIGGGFGAGIHNTLEAAAFSLPIIIGPKYHKFKEARDMIQRKTAFSISNRDELNNAAAKLLTDTNYRRDLGMANRDYVNTRTGATQMILQYIAGTIES